jgi:excinuclease ABC subunit C
VINEVEKVINGKTSSLIKELDEKMKIASEKMNFEEAASIRNKIQSLEVYTERQKVVSEDLLDKDIFAFVKEENDACAMVLNIRDGKVIGKRHFYIDNVEEKMEAGGEDEILESMIFKYYSENNFIPDEIYLQKELENTDAITEWFGQKFDKKVDISVPQRGDKVKLVSMVKANAQYMLDELKLQRLKREFIPHSVTSLKRDLRLTKLPRRIECFDISNIQGTDTVASMVVFFDGRPKKTDYRKFKMRSSLNEVGKPDDFASMREVIYRRYIKIAQPEAVSLNDNIEITNHKSQTSDSKGWDVVPDLIVIDGGKGQLSSAVQVLNDIGLKNMNIIGLAKRLEEVFLPEHNEAQSIPKTSSGLKLLQRVRDEAHRFAITFHRSLRDKRTLKSELESIKGIGKKTAQKLLTDFGSVEKIREDIKNNYEEFENKAGKKISERLKEFFNSN